MKYQHYYWRADPDAPFAALLSVVNTMCHPETYDEAYAELKRLARDPKPGEKMRRFKSELRTAIADPEQIPGDALFDAAEYSDGSDEKFLNRLWRDLYGSEPVE